MAANWTGGTPASGTTTLLNFNTAGSYGTINDLAGTFQLNQLNFGGPTLTLSGNSLQLTGTAPQMNQNSASQLTISSSVDFAANTILGGSGGGNVTFTGVLSGSGSLTKTIGGTLKISGINSTFSGGLTVQSGTLNPYGNGTGSSQPYLGTGTVTLAGGLTLQPTDPSGQVVRLPNAFNLSGGTVSVPIPFGGGTDFWLDGNISGAGGFSISGGTRWLALFGSNTFSGGVTINDGNQVRINNANGLGTGTLTLGNASGGLLSPQATVSGALANTINLASGGNLSVDTGGGSLNLSGSITNTGGLIKNGGNTLTLSGVNTYSGATTLNAGSLVLSNTLALQNSTLTVSAGTLTFASSLGAFTLGGVSGSTALGLINAAGLPVVLTIGNNNSGPTYSGALSGAGSLTKNGSGTVILSGANTYSGVTTVVGGVLQLANSSALGTSTDVVLTTGSGAINLNFAGNCVVNAVFTNGIKLPVGTYGASGSIITGTGFLQVTSGSSSARKDFLTFTFPSIGAAAIAGTNISITAPFGTVVTSLAPTYTASLLASGSPASAAAGNFTTPQTYTVTAQDGSTKAYRVTVNVVTASTNKDILTCTLPGNPAVIAGTNITLTVPYGSAVTNLAPTYTVSALAAGAPVSGTTNNFTAPQTYTITAEDTSTKAYRVTVVISPASTNKDILTFGLPGNAATIVGTNITLTVPGNQPATNLAPTYTISQFATASPLSGSTNNFVTPLTYTVTAQDGSTKNYLVTVQTFAAWSNSASFYIMTATNGANLAGSVSETNFPILLRLNTSFFNFGQAKANGDDLRFSTAAGGSLPYQIEQWDAANGLASIWVQIPLIKGNTNQQFVMYWGKSDATSQSSGLSVFNSTNGYLTVLHMNETIQDVVGSVSPTDTGTSLTTGMIGKGRSFNGGVGLNCGTSINNFPTGSNPHSTEVWFKATASGSTIVSWGMDQNQGKLVVQLQSPPRINVDTYFSGGNVSGGSTLALSQWYHVAHTYNSGATKLYVNGVLDGTGGGSAMNIPNPVRMYVGGFLNGAYSYVGDIDEVRISKVTRSADWVKMEYENQKSLQTMVGNLVPAGNAFSVSPAAVMLNEGAITNIIAQAGGAMKVYWIYKSNGQESVVATDQLSLPLAAGRLTGNQSYVMQFKAVYPNGSVQTNDIPVTVMDTIPDPVFTLVPSTNLWNGRQTMTVTANLSNLAAMQAAGATNLSYTWSVAGVAVTKQISNGTLTLLRSQGTGPMTATLVMNNGGALITNTVTVTVQEPATDAWVVRTPGATEKAVNNQFYARDDTGYGTVYYNGTLGGAPTSVFLNIYTNGPGGDVLYTNISQTLSGGSYAFTARIAAGLVAYKVVFGSITGATTNILDTVTNVVCGDAFILEGQSNTVATDSLPAETTTSPWIRSYGWSGGGWGSAVRNGTEWWIGYWGMDLATNLVATQNIPICIINGAVGGTRIDQHQPNPANHYIADSYGNTIYANLLNRVAGAKLTHGIRAVLWHQGENNSGAAAPTGDYDFKSYEQYFVDMSAAWKQDYPNILHYDIFQVYPNPCSMGGTFASDSLREVQRTLPRLFSKMNILSTIGLPGYIGCHYTAAGYTQIATLVAPLVKQDNYGLVPPQPVTAPNLKQAYFTTTNRTQITLEFDQNMIWNSAATVNFYLDRIGGKVTSGSASNNVIRLQVTGATTNLTIGYVVDQYWNFSSANLLYGSNGIAALTFYAVPLAVSGAVTVSLTNLPASGITASAGVLNTTLVSAGTNGAVSVYWNTVNAGTNAAQWTNSAYVGAWTNVTATNLSYTATGLAPSTTYYFTFRATNTTFDVWATNVQSFNTLALLTPPLLPGSAITVTGGVPAFTFATVAGYQYRLAYKNGLMDAVWQAVIAPPNFPLPNGWSAVSTGSPMSLTDTNSVGQPQRFYRIEAQ